METYAISGVAGFIGSNLAESILARGDRVRGLDNFHSGKMSNLRHLSDVELIEGDVRDPLVCKKLCKGADYVLHHAAIASVPLSMRSPGMANEVNITGTLNLLSAARDEGVSRFIFAGSSAIYGTDPVLPKRENMLPSPVSPYAVAKMAGEHYCRVFNDSFGLPTVSLRYFNVFGKRQDPDGAYAAVIPRFVDRLIKGIAPEIYGDGGQTRDFCYIEDVVAANLTACVAKDAPGGVFNIGSGRATSLNELYMIISELLGLRIKPKHLPLRAGDVRHSLGDVSLARDKLGFSAFYDVRDGLKKTIDWYVENSLGHLPKFKGRHSCAAL